MNIMNEWLSEYYYPIGSNVKFKNLTNHLLKSGIDKNTTGVIIENFFIMVKIQIENHDLPLVIHVNNIEVI